MNISIEGKGVLDLDYILVLVFSLTEMLCTLVRAYTKLLEKHIYSANYPNYAVTDFFFFN